MTFPTLETGVISCIVVIYVCLYSYQNIRRTRLGLPLPPGPKKLPIIGNLLDIPYGFEWLTYHKWCVELGSDIIHMDVAGTSIIVIDTAEIAMDLLEKRSSIYSGRARLPMVRELMGWTFNFGLMAYGDRWRQHRRLMHHSFHPTAALRFRPYQVKATHGLLRRLLDKPDDLMDLLKHMAGETVLRAAYGIQVDPEDDPYIATAERAVRSLVAAIVPGAFLVDTFPVLKYVPDWVPFAGFKRKAKEWRGYALRMVDLPYEAAKRNIANGESTASFVSDCFEKLDDAGDVEQQEFVIKSTAGTLYTAATDTTVSAIASCILGFLTNPEALKKAQREIDLIVKPGHLPTFHDEPSLPYITAVFKEALRWRDVTPMAIPHFLQVEDEYKGYRLPAGSIIIANSWAMLHREDIYPDPFTFNPDRFLKDGKLNPAIKDPIHAAFGFGRRICPGRFMAMSAVWIALASIIATFDITKAVDEDGEVIEPSQKYESAIVCLPLPFKCSIKSRSPEAEAAIRATANTD